MDEPVRCDDEVLGGLPMVRLRGPALARSEHRRWQILDELLDTGRNGAFVTMVDARTALAHVIRDRHAGAAVGALVGEARRRGQERPNVYHLHGGVAAVVTLVRKHGASFLDPRDAELVGRIESLPAVASTPEEDESFADTAVELAATCWRRGEVADADLWCERLREDDIPAAAIHIGWALVGDAGLAEEGHERDYDAAVRWMRHRAELDDPAAVRVSDEMDRLADARLPPRAHWHAAMRKALTTYLGTSEPARTPVPLGPAVLDLGDVEAVLRVVREHGGAPAVIGWGPRGAARIVDLGSQRPAALRRLLVTSADRRVEVVLDRRASHVSGPDPTPKRIRQIVTSRRRLWPAYLHPLVWRRVLFPSGILLASVLIGFSLGAADGVYDRGVVPYVVAVTAGCAVHMLYRLVVLPSMERTWQGNIVGGPVRIIGRRRRA